MSGQVHANTAQHVGELPPGEHAVPVLVYLSETPPETLDLVRVRK